VAQRSKRYLWLWLAAVAVLGLVFWQVALSDGTAPRDPQAASIVFLLRTSHLGGECFHLRPFIGRGIAPGLIRCTGSGMVMISNARNGTVLRVPNPFDLERVWQSGDERLYLESRNGYLFRVKAGELVDFIHVDSDQVDAIESGRWRMPPEDSVWVSSARTRSGRPREH